MDPPSLLTVGLRLAKAKPACLLGASPAMTSSRSTSLTTRAHVSNQSKKAKKGEVSQPKGSKSRCCKGSPVPTKSTDSQNRLK